MTFSDNRTEGYEAYIAVFPNGLNIDEDEIPWQLDVSSTMEPFAVERCVELGLYLKQCAEDWQPADARGYIDAVYLYDGLYEFGGICEADYTRFVKAVSQLDCKA